MASSPKGFASVEKRPHHDLARSVWSACSLLPLSNVARRSSTPDLLEIQWEGTAAASCAHSKRFARLGSCSSRREHPSEVKTPPSKSALGRGLGDLMKRAEVAPPTPSAPPAGQPSALTPGMAALLRDNAAPVSGPARLQPGSETANPPPELRFEKWMLRGSLLLADVLLLGLAAWLIVRGGHPLSWVQVALCVLAVAMGAWLTFLGLWWEWKGRQG